MYNYISNMNFIFFLYKKKHIHIQTFFFFLRKIFRNFPFWKIGSPLTKRVETYGGGGGKAASDSSWTTGRVQVTSDYTIQCRGSRMNFNISLIIPKPKHSKSRVKYLKLLLCKVLNISFRPLNLASFLFKQCIFKIHVGYRSLDQSAQHQSCLLMRKDVNFGWLPILQL